jgi:hypothetical protein
MTILARHRKVQEPPDFAQTPKRITVLEAQRIVDAAALDLVQVHVVVIGRHRKSGRRYVTSFARRLDGCDRDDARVAVVRRALSLAGECRAATAKGPDNGADLAENRVGPAPSRGGSSR